MANKEKSPFKFIVIGTIVVVAIFVALAMLTNSKSETDLDQVLAKPISIEGQPTIGDADAPVTVVEFGDYKCPSCKVWGDEFYPRLLDEYIETGKVKFAYINVLFHGEESELGSKAAEAVHKQSPESYWEFHKKLFNEQPTTTDHDTVWLTMEKVKEVASSIPGIDLDQLQADIQSQAVSEEVNKDTVLGEEVNVEKTPTVIVNGTVLENPFDYEKIISLIDAGIVGTE